MLFKYIIKLTWHEISFSLAICRKNDKSNQFESFKGFSIYIEGFSDILLFATADVPSPLM